MSHGEFLLSIDGFPYLLATAGVSAVGAPFTSHTDYPDGATLLSDALEPVNQSWSERMDLLEGSITVDSMRFTLNDLYQTFNSAQRPFLTWLFSRDDDQLAYTDLASSMTAGAGTFTVRDGSAISSKIPGVLWIESEAINCSSIATNTVTVAGSGRGYYGTRALKHTVNIAQNLYPEVWGDFPWIYRRKCILWFAEQTGTVTTAVPLWRGYASRPELAANGAQWQINAEHVWNRYKQARLGIESATTRLRGFDKTRMVVRVSWHGAPGNGFGVSSGAIRGISNTVTDAINEVARRLNDSLDAYETASNVFFTVSGSYVGGTVKFTVTSLGVSSLIIQVDQWGGVGGMNSGNVNTSDPRIATVEVRPAPTAIVRRSVEPGPIPISSTANLLDISEISTSDTSLQTSAQFFLRGNWPDDSTYLLLIPSQNGYLSDSDSDVNGPSFTGIMSLEPKEGSLTSQFTGLAHDMVDDAVLLHQVARINTQHWYAGLQMTIGTGMSEFFGDEIDSRDWDLSSNPSLISRTGGPFSGRIYTFDATETIGYLLQNELVANGCALRIAADGKLRIVLIDQPTANTAKVTIPETDLLAESVDNQGILNNGMVVNSVSYKSPGVTINVSNEQSRRRYGDGRKLEVELKHLNRVTEAETHPEELAKRALSRLLMLFSVPRKQVIIEVPWLDYYQTVFAGSWITYSSATLPNQSGNRGASAITAQVISRDCDPAQNRMRLSAMVLRTSFGYSPCVRVASISGAVITCATDYVKGTSDYAQSDATDYQQTANDYGVGWFANGYVCSLVLRDSTTDTRELGLVVSSVNTGARTITMTASIPTSPTNWASIIAGGSIVDLRFDKYNDVVTTQQTNFAWVGSDTDGVIDGTDDRVQEWSA